MRIIIKTRINIKAEVTFSKREGLLLFYDIWADYTKLMKIIC